MDIFSNILDIKQSLNSQMRAGSPQKIIFLGFIPKYLPDGWRYILTVAILCIRSKQCSVHHIQHHILKVHYSFNCTAGLDLIVKMAPVDLYCSLQLSVASFLGLIPKTCMTIIRHLFCDGQTSFFFILSLFL